ncbi:MAG: DUF2797 domain-containing protein [Bacteroidia bacterium]
MQSYTGDLRKMGTRLGDPVQYKLALHGSEILAMNTYIGQPISIAFSGDIFCIRCGRKTEKSFGQGYCYPCFASAPESSPCIINPERCEGHKGIGRDIGWERMNHVKPHVVYLAISSGLKVGVTREDQVPTRWIDQGAFQAIILAETPYRQLAGEIEVSLKAHLSDKTSWQRMLKNDIPEGIDLLAEKARVGQLLSEDHQDYISDEDHIQEIHYPVTEYPAKVKSVNLDKLPEISGTLLGIKGQYLMLDEGRVFNVRRHSGYRVNLSI